MANESSKVGAGDDSPYVQCVMRDEVDAIIVFPSLGAPQILPEAPNECSIIIATDSHGMGLLREPGRAAVLVNHHLRLIGFDDDKALLPLPIDHKFYGAIDDKLYDENNTGIAKAQEFIAVERLGFKDCVLTRQGKAIGCLSHEAYALYGQEGYTAFLSVTLKKLSRSAYKFSAAPQSWAWVVRTNATKKAHVFLKPDGTEHPIAPSQPVKVHQPLDRLIHNAFVRLSKRAPAQGGTLKDEDLFEVPVEEGKYGAPKKEGCRRVQAWHPVMTKAPAPLRLGHLTDIHISVRTATIARSRVKVIEDGKATGGQFEPVGERVAHTYKSFKALIDAVKDNGADALAITGDAVDFSLNLDPRHTANMGTVGEVWGALNAIANARKEGGGYKRNIDQLYFYSLLLYALRVHKLPAYYVSGNHEAYQWPYGISPRVDGSLGGMAASKTVNKEAKKDVSNYAVTLHNFTEAEKAAWEGLDKAKRALNAASQKLYAANHELAAATKAAAAPGAGPGAATRLREAERTQAAAAQHKHRLDKDHASEQTKFNAAADRARAFQDRFVEEASQYHQNKANEGIPADHNLTIYEACLAYGPTYGQVMSAHNFRRDQFDWFHWLYAPFSDLNVYPCCTSLVGEGATQAITLLGWGADERFLDLGNLYPKGQDRRGKSFLPYATESISAAQLGVIKAAAGAAAEARWTVLSHFTVASFEESVPASIAPQDAGFRAGDAVKSNPFVQGGTNAQYNFFNWGGCELGLKTYLDGYTAMGAAPGAGQVGLHLSGHSHRGGVYTLRKRKGSAGDGVDIECRVPWLQSLPASDKGTRYVVGTAGGPLGRQALSGWHPKQQGWADHGNALLGGWLARPPSGLVVDTGSGRIDYVKAPPDPARHDLPRLAVMLDYRDLTGILKGAHATRPIVVCGERYASDGVFLHTGLPVALSEEAQALGCMQLDNIRVWVYKAGPAAQTDTDNARGSTAAAPAAPASDAKGGWLVSRAHIRERKPEDGLGRYRGAHALFLADAATVRSAFTHPTDGAQVPCAFLEIPLRRPKHPGSFWGEVNCEESWVFPVEIARVAGANGMEILFRGEGESGEVPDWKFLEEHLGYPNAFDITTDKPQKS